MCPRARTFVTVVVALVAVVASRVAGPGIGCNGGVGIGVGSIGFGCIGSGVRGVGAAIAWRQVPRPTGTLWASRKTVVEAAQARPILCQHRDCYLPYQT